MVGLQRAEALLWQLRTGLGSGSQGYHPVFQRQPVVPSNLVGLPRILAADVIHCA